MKSKQFKLKVLRQIIKLHYQKLGILLAEPKSEKRDVLIYAIEQKLVYLDNQDWELFRSIVKL